MNQSRAWWCRTTRRARAVCRHTLASSRRVITRITLLFASVVAIAAPLTWLERGFISRSEPLTVPPPGLFACLFASTFASLTGGPLPPGLAPPSVSAALPVETTLCGAVQAPALHPGDERESSSTAHVTSMTVALRDLGSLAPSLTVTAIAGSARPWRNDIALNVAVYPSDPTRVTFLWGDHVETERTAGGYRFFIYPFCVVMLLNSSLLHGRYLHHTL